MDKILTVIAVIVVIVLIVLAITDEKTYCSIQKFGSSADLPAMCLKYYVK